MKKEEEKDFIVSLLNHEKEAMDGFYKICKDLSKYTVYRFYNSAQEKSSLITELAEELYLYVMEDEKILQGFKGTCPLGAFLFSVAKNFFSSFRLFEDPAITKIKKKIKEKRDKEEDEIREFDDNPLLFFVYKPTQIPAEFVGDNENDALVNDNECNPSDDIDAEEEDNPKDILVDIKEALNVSIEDTTLSSCELVKKTLDMMLPKEAIVLRKSYIEKCDALLLAKEFNLTINAFYNFRSTARKNFQLCYKKLKNEYYE